MQSLGIYKRTHSFCSSFVDTAIHNIKEMRMASITEKKILLLGKCFYNNNVQEKNSFSLEKS